MPDLAVGSETGAILSLAIDPLRPTTVYAGTQGGGVFNTVDGGKRWSATGKIL